MELLGYSPVTLIKKRRFSNLFLAQTQTFPPQDIVIKVFDTLSLEDGQELQTFLEEIKGLQALEHQNILHMLDVGINHNHPYIISSYCQNGSLRLRLNQAHLSLEETLKIVRQIGEALIYVHTHQIVHGNLKPENVLFGDEEIVFLTDFHTPFFRKQLKELRHYPHSPTIAYMAPEGFRHHYSPSSDQYSLACLAYEMITGSVPFPAVSFTTSQHKHNNTERPSLKSFVSTLPNYIETVILKAMSKQPEDRYKDVEAFLGALTPTYELQPSSEFIGLDPLPNVQNGGSTIAVARIAEVATNSQESKAYSTAKFQDLTHDISPDAEVELHEPASSAVVLPVSTMMGKVTMPQAAISVEHVTTPPAELKMHVETSPAPLIRKQHTHKMSWRIGTIASFISTLVLLIVLPLFMLPTLYSQSNQKVPAKISTSLAVSSMPPLRQNTPTLVILTPSPKATPKPAPTSTPAPTSIAILQNTRVAISNPIPVQAPTPTPAPVYVSISYEAESPANSMTGIARTNGCAACSGGMDVVNIGLISTAIGPVNCTLTFNITMSRAGSYKLTIYYINGDPMRTAYLSVNGGASTAIEFPQAGAAADWSVVNSVSLIISLPQGKDTLTFSNTTAPGPDLDRLIV